MYVYINCYVSLASNSSHIFSAFIGRVRRRLLGFVKVVDWLVAKRFSHRIRVSVSAYVQRIGWKDNRFLADIRRLLGTNS
jgi:hypothetical protein